MHETFELTCVAYSRSTGGTMRLLLAIERDGEPLFDGEPALLVEHRPGDDPSSLRAEGPDALDAAATELVRTAAAQDLAALVDSAFDRTGELRADLLLDRSVRVELPRGTFDT
jgi:hypothetical protein